MLKAAPSAHSMLGTRDCGPAARFQGFQRSKECPLEALA